MTKEITIAGGGLAGLSLGIALRQRGIAATLHEAGGYPRHRVCGEFISGVGPEVFEALGLNGVLDGALEQRSTVWLRRDLQVFSGQLPSAAKGISRFELDDQMRTRFQELGGRLVTNSRLTPSPMEGTVWCAGRFPAKSPWLGLKCHVRELELRADLEMHLGGNGYVGLARVGDGVVNVCGLFRQDRALTGKDLLFQYLEAGGLSSLRNRLDEAEIDEASASAVAGFQLGWQPIRPGLLSLGDACGMIPPFTGNGMSMAFESAAVAADPVAAYARGGLDWNALLSDVSRRLRRKFAARLFYARLMHPFLTRSAGQSFLSGITRARLLPFNLCFHALR
ncbi:NAD(P)/FAD-dependent oxidoreductase [soil metagenome]